MRLLVEPLEPRAAGPDPRGGERFLPLVLPRQARSRWCWAAIAVALGAYHGGRPRSQAEVARAVLGPQPASGPEGDREAALERALAAVGCSCAFSPGRPDLARVRAEIDAGRPVPVCVDWRAGGAHYVVVSGYGRGGLDLLVADPLHGPSLQSAPGFPRAYRSGGYWRGTYWTTGPGDAAGQVPAVSLEG